MERHFETELKILKNNLIKMASIVEEQIESTFLLIKFENLDAIQNLKLKEKEVDQFDNLIIEQVGNILALFQPVASDLRFLLSSISISKQLERCGDIALNINQRIKKNLEYKYLLTDSGLIEMFSIAREMLKDSIDAFINSDLSKARFVLKQDEQVDIYNKNVFKYLTEKMKSATALILPASHFLILSRHIERLADHSTNISEDVIFFISSDIVAHNKNIKQQL